MVFIFEIANFDLLLMLLSDMAKIFSFDAISMGLYDDATSHLRWEINFKHSLHDLRTPITLTFIMNFVPLNSAKWKTKTYLQRLNVAYNLNANMIYFPFVDTGSISSEILICYIIVFVYVSFFVVCGPLFIFHGSKLSWYIANCILHLLILGLPQEDTCCKPRKKS